MAYRTLKIVTYHIPDIIALIIISISYSLEYKLFNAIAFYTLITYILFKSFMFIYYAKFYYYDRLIVTREIIENFKKGKFAVSINKPSDNDELGLLTNELMIIGKYIDDTITTLKEETEQLRELYNNIVYSISSYSIILNENHEIIFTNDSFCKKFQLTLDEIIGQNIDDIFFFVTEKLKDAIRNVKTMEEPVVLEKVHLLSKSRVSVVTDIKISRMFVQGANQIILIIDDITSRCRKDYQMNLISQVTESIQRDDEIDHILYSILFAVTAGEGLGFNRAILFLVDDKKKNLVGEMAVGPDSIEEAIQIWNSLPPGSIDITNLVNTYDDPARKGSKLLDKVTNIKFDIDSDNVFIRSLKQLKYVHIYDAWNDPSISSDIKEFMDVNEFVVVPLVIENRAIGVIIADNKFNQVPIGKDHIELLSIFAVQASLLIESYHSVSTLKKEMDKIMKRQDAMIESEKLAAVGRISSHIAHEIRNPLVTMGGYAKRILQFANGNEKVRKAAEVIQNETERLESILSNVMDISKPQTLYKKLNNINEAITDTISLMKNVLQEKSIKITTNLNKKIPPVNSDYNQIKQVMLNLLQNAIDAIPGKGEIAITTDTDNENVIITVSDTGTGIEKENLENLFEPFFSTKITGVGLGLAIVNKIIKDHNGEITGNNKKTTGAEFIIKLPVPH